jgi:hypothetical protein
MRTDAIPTEARETPAEVVTWSDDELLEYLVERETASRTALADQARAIAELAHRDTARQSGARNTKALLQRLLRISGPEATTRVTVAEKVTDHTSPSTSPSTGPIPPELPATAGALQEGAIGLDHARVIVDGIRAVAPFASPSQVQQAEAQLADNARMLGPRDLKILAERLAYYFDQDGAAKTEERQIAARELHFGVARDGMTVLKGRLDRETGGKLRAALEPLAAPQPHDDDTPDPRTPGERNADALSNLLDIALATDQLPRSGGQRPHLTVTIDYDSLQQRIPPDLPGAAGTLETTGQPLTAATVRRLACDADILPIVLGSQGQPLDVGRTQRTAPPHLRAALLARDTDCAFPGCDHPPGASEAHHAQHWADGGQTALNNMVMLCGAHHRIVHQQGWNIDLTTGHPLFIPPSTVDPWRRPRPGNRPLRHHDLTSLTAA